MTVRAAVPGDAPGILEIAVAQRLPHAWTLPPDNHVIVAEYRGRVVAFCALTETAYGLVVNELWESLDGAGMCGLSRLRRRIEEMAQELADRRGAPLQCGGLVRLDHERHIAALRKRGYVEEAVVLAKVFTPRAQVN